MSCETCPIACPISKESRLVEAGTTDVRIYQEGGIYAAYTDAGGSHRGLISMSSDILANDHPALEVGIQTCASPLTPQEAIDLGNAALAGNCRPMTGAIGNYRDPAAVEIFFRQPPTGPPVNSKRIEF